MEEIRESWGWQYDFVKWASKIVITVVGALISLLTLLGVLSSKASAASATPLSAAPASTSSSTIAMTGLAAISTSATLGISVALGPTDTPQPELAGRSTPRSGIAGEWVSGTPMAPIDEPSPDHAPMGLVTIAPDGDGYAIQKSLSVYERPCGTWSQYLEPTTPESEAEVLKFKGGDIAADQGRCDEIINEVIGPSGWGPPFPTIDRLRYDTRMDRIEFWSSHPMEPYSEFVGPYYLHRAP